MRDKVGVLIGPTYLVPKFSPQKMGSFADWRSALLSPQTK